MTIWTALGSALTPLLKAASSVAPKPARLPVALPQYLPVPADSTRDEIDKIVSAVDARKEDWVRVSTKERAALLKVRTRSFAGSPISTSASPMALRCYSTASTCHTTSPMAHPVPNLLPIPLQACVASMSTESETIAKALTAQKGSWGQGHGEEGYVQLTD